MKDEYSTQDYSLANWLVFKGVVLLGAIEYPGEVRKSFVFTSRPDVEQLVEEWYSPTKTDTKTCKKFFAAHSIIKKSLKDSMDVTRALSDS